MAYLHLAIAIIGEVIGTSALNASAGFTKPIPSFIVIIGYSISFYFLSLTLKTFSIGVVYAIWSGAGIVLLALVGFMLFKQSIDTPALIGMGLIVAGVIYINLFSNTVAH